MNIDELAAEHDDAMRRGDTATCIRVLHELIAQMRQLGQRALEADFIRQLANAHQDRGELGEAQSLRVAAAKMAQEIPDFPPVLRQWIENDLGRTYIEVHQWPQAEVHVDRALQMAEGLGLERERCLTLMNKSLVCANTGRITEARRLGDKVVSLAKQTGNRYTLARQYLNLSLWSFHDLKLTDCMRYARLAVEQAAIDGDKRVDGSAKQLLGKAQIYARGLTAGNFDSAEGRRLLEESFQAAQTLDNRPAQLVSLIELGELHETCRRNDEAARCFQEALKLLEATRSDLGYEDFQLSYFQTFEDKYARIGEFHLRQGRPDQAFLVSEQARSRILLALLGEGAGNIGLWDPPSRQTLAETLKDYGGAVLASARGSTGHTRNITLGIGAPEDASLSADHGLTAARRRFLNLFESQRLHRTELNDSQSPALIDFAQSQQGLGNDAALVSYVVTSRSILIFVATDQSRHFQHLAYPAEKIAEDVAAVCTAMSELQDSLINHGQWLEGPNSWPQEVRDAWLQLEPGLRKLFAPLIAPVLGVIDDHRHWIIVPHGPLHRVPWAALRRGDRYLIEDHTLNLLPSVSSGVAVQSRPSGNGNQAVFFADPDPGDLTWGLPAAEREVLAARAHFQHGPAPFVGPAATKAEFLRQAPAAHVLHLACHHQFDAAAPLLSFLKMAGFNGSQFLYAFEIAELRLIADLAVLSACQSGRSRIATGDEQMGIVWSFLAAGVKSVVSTLWNIEDESAAEFFTHFYQAIRTSDLPSALRSSQLKLLKDPRFMLPNFWSPYQLSGDWTGRLHTT